MKAFSNFSSSLRMPNAVDSSGREENRLKEGGWDGEVSEKSLAMSPCGLFS